MATRVEQAITMQYIPAQVPQEFVHSAVPDKPLPPVPVLDGPDTDRYTIWLQRRTDGTLQGFELANASPSLLAAVAAYEAYTVSPELKAWTTIDNISREQQYRLLAVDTALALDAQPTGPPSQDSTADHN